METIDLFLTRPVALFIVLAIGASIGMGVERLTAHFAKQKRLGSGLIAAARR